MKRRRRKGTANRSFDAEILGAVDLGSNSFHMVIGRFAHGQLTVMDRLREPVRLAAGLDKRQRLDHESQERALDCLARFGQRLRNVHVSRVRVVGTNTLRKARDAGKFLERAAKVLGHRVEVIAGIEEARLIYLGVSHSLPTVAGSQLVVDIGGGSTEIIRGRGFRPDAMESLYIGCVGLSEGYFADGRITPRNFRIARQAARLELEPLKARFARPGLVRVAGASGTIRAAHDVLVSLGRARKGLRLKDLEYLIDVMVSYRNVRGLRLPGLSDDRAEVFPGGVAILTEVIASLGIERMVFADGALREGILYDMVGRLTNEDARVRTVRAMQERFRVDTAQADRVTSTALSIWSRVASDWGIAAEADRNLLTWAGKLHELGLDIAHAHYHHHGAYLLENADMPGFARDDQKLLALIVRAHRRKLSPEHFTALPREWRLRILRLSVLLRLAALLHRTRSRAAMPRVGVTVANRSIRVKLPARWLHENPLTEADLARECRYLTDVDVVMKLGSARR
jgi:exopolyphosphatase / guanosine-5'-triphosphate,3'-diphosphate pyrophosphatase